MRLAKAMGIKVTDALRRAFAELDPKAPQDARELATLWATSFQRSSPGVVGLSGGQGVGKTTLSTLLVEALRSVGRRACVVSIDDFYYTRAERQSRAHALHPLFETRGPPGTHDVRACAEALHQLRRPGYVELPIFDKGLDDRAGTRRLEGPYDLILFEGWCVGAPPQPTASLAVPVNALEAERDAAGIWRSRVNEELAGPYQALWRELEVLIFLAVPDLAAVHRWRFDQESERSADERLSRSEIVEFVAHYERLTLWMLQEMPNRADWVVEWKPDHSVAAVRKTGLP